MNDYSLTATKPVNQGGGPTHSLSITKPVGQKADCTPKQSTIATAVAGAAACVLYGVWSTPNDTPVINFGKVAASVAIPFITHLFFGSYFNNSQTTTTFVMSPGQSLIIDTSTGSTGVSSSTTSTTTSSSRSSTSKISSSEAPPPASPSVHVVTPTSGSSLEQEIQDEDIFESTPASGLTAPSSGGVHKPQLAGSSTRSTLNTGGDDQRPDFYMLGRMNPQLQLQALLRQYTPSVYYATEIGDNDLVNIFRNWDSNERFSLLAKIPEKLANPMIKQYTITSLEEETRMTQQIFNFLYSGGSRSNLRNPEIFKKILHLHVAKEFIPKLFEHSNEKLKDSVLIEPKCLDVLEASLKSSKPTSTNWTTLFNRGFFLLSDLMNFFTLELGEKKPIRAMHDCYKQLWNRNTTDHIYQMTLWGLLFLDKNRKTEYYDNLTNTDPAFYNQIFNWKYGGCTGRKRFTNIEESSTTPPLQEKSVSTVGEGESETKQATLDTKGTPIATEDPQPEGRRLLAIEGPEKKES